MRGYVTDLIVSTSPLAIRQTKRVTARSQKAVFDIVFSSEGTATLVSVLLLLDSTGAIVDVFSLMKTKSILYGAQNTFLNQGIQWIQLIIMLLATDWMIWNRCYGQIRIESLEEWRNIRNWK